MTDEQAWFTPEIAAEWFRVKPRTIWRWCALGRLRARKLGRSWYVHVSEREAYYATGEIPGRGLVVPADPRQALGGGSHHADGEAPFEVKRLGWSLPPEVAR